MKRTDIIFLCDLIQITTKQQMYAVIGSRDGR